MLTRQLADVGRTVEATEAKLGALLQDRANLVVPSFQRRYVWGDAQQRGLWNAVVEQYRLAQTAGGIDEVDEKDKDHFVGAFVLMKGKKGKSTDPKPLLVIDGQQRMTSIVMLLCALRDWLATDEDGVIDEAAVADCSRPANHARSRPRRRRALAHACSRPLLSQATTST